MKDTQKPSLLQQGLPSALQIKSSMGVANVTPPDQEQSMYWLSILTLHSKCQVKAMFITVKDQT